MLVSPSPTSHSSRATVAVSEFSRSDLSFLGGENGGPRQDVLIQGHITPELAPSGRRTLLSALEEMFVSAPLPQLCALDTPGVQCGCGR